MRRRIISAVSALLLILTFPATAQVSSLQGHWEVRTQNPKRWYKGVLLVDVEGRATWDAPNDGGRVAKFLGYINHSDEQRFEVMLTDRAVVAKVRCTRHSKDLASCTVHRDDSSVSGEFLLARVGAGPIRLTGN